MSTNPTAVIAEDEPLLAQGLVDALSRLWPELRIIATVADGGEAQALIERERPDVAFLDVRMPEKTGIEVAREVAGRCHVVFVTAYDAYAVPAFEHGAVDYLLKPIDDERLALTIERLRPRLSSPPQDIRNLLTKLSAREETSYLRWVQAGSGARIRFIAMEEVCYFRAEDKYTKVVTGDDEALIRTPIKELVAKLDPNQFWQIHRSTIVSLRFLIGIERHRDGGMEVLLRGHDERLPVSQAYQHRFKQM